VTQRLSIGTAWTEATAGLRRERRLLAPVVLGLIMLPSVVGTMIQPAAAPGTTAPPGPWMIGAFAIVLVTIVGQMAVVLLVDGWRGSVGEAIARAGRRLPSLLLAGLILILPLLIASGLLFMAIGGVRTTSPQQLGSGGALAALLFIGVVLFIAIRLLPMVAIAATGTDGPIALLRRGWRATQGKFWRLFGFFLLWIVAFLIVTLAVGAVIGTVITLLFGKPEPWSVALLLVATVTGLIQALFVTIYTAMLARIAVQIDPSSSNGM
jgi:hypothetical protein